jgi:signal transduction histidine kinase
VAETVEPRPRRRTGLGSRLVALVLLVTIPLAVLSAVAAIIDRRRAADDARSRTAEIVAIGAVVIPGLVTQTDIVLGTVDHLSNPTGAFCQVELPAALGRDSIYDDLYSVDEDGTITCTAQHPTLDDDISGTEWFQRTKARDASTFTVPAEGVTTDAMVMIVSRPRRAPEGPRPETTGIIAASLDPQLMVAYAEGLDLPPGSVVQVVDDHGRVVARNVDSESYQLDPTTPFEAMVGRQSGSFEGKGVDNVDRLYSYERIEVDGQTVYLMAGISRDEAYGAANAHLIWTLVLLAVLGVGVGAVAVAAGRSTVTMPIERLRRAMAGFRAGDVSQRAGAIGGPAEIVELGTAFDAMADEIQERLDDQQRLLDQLEEASEAERQSIAAGIHDETLQNLNALGIRLQLLRRGSDDRQQAELDRSLELLQGTATQLRGLLFDLRPPEFDRIGLAATLRETVEVRLGADLNGWSVAGEISPEVPYEAQILLYRVAQQSLANVREHAAARRVDIRFATNASVISMEVTDDGHGFDVSRVEADARPGHIGLHVMRDRVRAVGGDLTITSRPGEGTTVRVEVPIVDGEPAED